MFYFTILTSSKLFSLPSFSSTTFSYKEIHMCWTDYKISFVQKLWLLPHSIPYEKGASILISYGTALMSLVRKAQLKQDETVLITAAAGAAGLAAVDIAAGLYEAKVLKML